MRRNSLAAFLVVVALSGTAMAADSIIAGEGKQSYAMALEKIVGFKDGMVIYLHSSGQERPKALRDILKISIDGQDVFNSAETNRTKSPEEAIVAYETVIAGEGVAWLKQLSRYRKVDTATKAGKVDAAVACWLEIVATDTSTAAIKLVPADVAEAGDGRNAEAIKALEPRLRELSRKDKTVHQAAVGLLMKLYRKEGMTAKADALAKGLTAEPEKEPVSPAPVAGSSGVGDRGGRTAAGSTGGTDTGTRVRGSALLTAAGGLIREGQKADTLKEQGDKLEGNMASFSAAELPQVFLLIGKARLYQAIPLKDAKVREALLAQGGLAFMRAKVAGEDKQPVLAAEALLLAGQACEQMGNLEAAGKAYQKLTTDKTFQGKAKEFVTKASDSLERVTRAMEKQKKSS